MTPTPSTRPSVQLQRDISAPAERVYRAWLEPDILRRWLAPGDMTVTRIEVDERVGGHYRVWQGTDGNDIGGFESRILELVPSKRIVLQWGFVGPERTAGPTYDSLLTITLEESPGHHTRLTLVHEQLDSLHADLPDVADQVGPGWGLALDKLVVSVAGPPAPPPT